MSLHTLVFMSRAVRPFSEDELIKLSRIACTNNRLWGITALLMYCDGDFIEAIEGSPDDVFRSFGRIACDPRHHQIEVLLSSEIDQRNFEAPSMGVLDASKESAICREEFRAIAAQARSDKSQAGQAALDMLLRFYERNGGWAHAPRTIAG